MLTIPKQENWLDAAVVHASTKWLEAFLREYLPQPHIPLVGER